MVCGQHRLLSAQVEGLGSDDAKDAVKKVQLAAMTHFNTFIRVRSA